MTKINRGYQSLFEYLVDKGFPLARWFDEYFYPDENSRLRYGSDAPYDSRRWNSSPYKGEQLLGALQPFVDMGKDFINTLKPYKTTYHALKDFLQPIWGIGNTIKGIANLIGAIVLFLGNTVRYAFASDSLSNFSRAMGINFYRTAAWLLDGISSTVRGITQFISTPLTWFIKMPLRGLITVIKGAPKIEQNSGIQRLVNMAKKDIEETKSDPQNSSSQYALIFGYKGSACVRYELHRKYQKAIKRGQKSNIPADAEKESFWYFKYFQNKHLSDPNYTQLQYYGLFSKDPEEQKASILAATNKFRPLP